MINRQKALHQESLQAVDAAYRRTALCGELGKTQVGEAVTIVGWVHRRRDLGGLIFIEVRDRSGIVQAVFNPQTDAAAYQVADQMRLEFVVAVSGTLVARDPQTYNPHLPTGEVEVRGTDAVIVSRSKPLPFGIDDDLNIEETVRLRYRYLDLRRPSMHESIVLRAKAMKYVRDFLTQHDFVEIETPLLTRSTPEGARDFLVPSRLQPGSFYALPQSPQLLKQVLMISGFERYFQIVRCFRDEDLRADRQPEFTQIDIETSFFSQQALMDLMEEMIAGLFEHIGGIHCERPFVRLTWDEAMNRYGSDKPDLRFELPLTDVTSIVSQSAFQVFAKVARQGGRIMGLRVPQGARLTRSEIDELTTHAATYGAKGLAWIAWSSEGPRSPILKFFTQQEQKDLFEALDAQEGDLLLFVADQRLIAQTALGQVRLKLGQQLGLIDEHLYRFAWITDFPMFEYNDEEKRWEAEHHPFTAPREEDLPYLESAPERVRAKAYDMVLNGYEIGGGSQRIYDPSLQERVFARIGLSLEEAHDKFGFLVEALQYGAPPHGGIAFGFDRLLMLLAGKENIREVIAFPKTASGADPLTGAPAPVNEKQLRELHLQLRRI